MFNKTNQNVNINNLALNSAIEQLATEDQNIVNYKLEGYNNQEIANKIGTSTATIHSHWKRIFGQLQVILKGKTDNESGKLASAVAKELSSKDLMAKMERKKNPKISRKLKGTIFVTNGTRNKRLDKDEPIPEGFYRGFSRIK